MRHEWIDKRNGFTEADIAAVWPFAAQIAPLPLPDIERTGDQEIFRFSSATANMSGAVGIVIVAVYAAMIALLAFNSVGPREADFTIASGAIFVVICLVIARIILGDPPKREPSQSSPRMQAAELRPALRS